MKFEITQNSDYHGQVSDSWDLKFNDEEIVTKASKEKIIKIIGNVLEALI